MVDNPMMSTHDGRQWSGPAQACQDTLFKDQVVVESKMN
jgi:hypothetical protein